jgi:hypothetical protein
MKDDEIEVYHAWEAQKLHTKLLGKAEGKRPLGKRVVDG